MLISPIKSFKISDKIQSKLQAWSNEELLKAGKLTLVKTTAQTTSNFWMSLFLIPDSICDEIERKILLLLFLYREMVLQVEVSSGLHGSDCVYQRSSMIWF